MARRPSDAQTESARAHPKACRAPSTPTTVAEQLEWATHVLGSVGATEPAREAATILASAMGLSGIPVEADPAAALAASHADRFLAAIVRRLREEPPRR